MQIVVHGNEALQAELASHGVQDGVQPIWVFEKVDMLQYKMADVVLDLLFENTAENKERLQQCSGLKIINSVSHTLRETHPSFVRINGWPTFLKAHTIEASAKHADLKKLTQTVFSFFNKTVQWLPDEPGFVVPRVVSMLVNEAHFALAEGISTEAEIDTAMKLGTAYPYGLFEWGEKIGLEKILELLRRLSVQQPRYTPAPLLLQKAIVI